MTIVEATGKLIEFFILNDYFSFKDDFLKVCIVSDSDGDKAAIRLALDNLEKENVVTKSVIENVEFWVLNTKLLNRHNNIQVSLLSCVEIANVLNKFIEEDDKKINPFNINEEEINGLITIIKNVLSKLEKSVDKE